MAAVYLQKLFSLPIALVGGLVIGLNLGGGQVSELKKYQPFYDQQVIVSGEVAEDIGVGDKGEKQLTLGSVTVNDQKLGGKIWLSAAEKSQIRRGDFVVASGKLQKGFGNMPASMYRAEILKIESRADFGRDVRDSFAQAVKQGLPSPQVDLALGFLLGQKNELPPNLDEQLKTLGLTHIVVASGYNLTILVKFARKSFTKISKWLSLFFSSSLVVTFILITGFSPSMNRAGLVTLLCLAAWYFGRNIHPLVLLPLAAAITIAIEPSSLWGDIGWYLSFSAFAGVIILAPLVNQYFWKDKPPGVVREIVVGTLCAQIITMPIIAYFFGQFSPLALPANVLVLPLIPVTMVLTFLSGLVGLIAPALASIAGQPAFWLLSYMTSVVDWISQAPFAKAEVTFNVFALIAGYIAILLTIVYLHRKTKFNFYSQSVLD